MSPRRTGVILLLVVLVAALSVPVALASLSGEPQPDSQPSGQNQVTAASIATQADLGRLLFFDPRLSGNGVTSCSSCHLPEKAWLTLRLP